MKKLLLAAIMILSLCIDKKATAQTTPNLITNGDFEQRNAPPHGPGPTFISSNIGPIKYPGFPYDDLKYWYRPSDNYSQSLSPRYIASDGEPGVNTTALGFTAHSSNSCITILRHDAPADKSYDDFVTQKLSQALQAGHLYHVEFWALRWSGSQFRTKLALSVTTGDPTYDGALNSLVPSPRSKVVVSADIQQYYVWVRVAGDITITDPGNQWVTIGYDRSDQTYDSDLPNNYPGAINFAIDDVSLVDMGCAPVPQPTIVVDEVHTDRCQKYIGYVITNFDSTFTYTVNILSGRINALSASPTTNQFRIKGGSGVNGGSFSVTAALTCGSTATTSEYFADFGCGSNRVAQESTAYPNPAAESLTLPEGVESATLLDSNGKPVKASSKSGKFDLQALPDGLYNLQMMQDGKLINQRIQVKH